ncbi:proline dehydrogenase family protein [Levilinea saccharolytica]|uniref:proline dehydrogenase family protein n=1 Tax=Levilinea saccharolytica TaxID=229921 RepID=UPI00078178B0|nr:proline dehydrogenase family protein [Levilinea saccharolytica]GAP17490.1 L-proline dehydrogenase [Levilinea saccharolytica]
MLRGFFILLSKVPWAQRVITRWGVARRAARRFVAGDTIADALQAALALNQAGMQVSLDPLGENTTHAEGAEAAAQEILTLLDSLHAHELRANVSIKLSQLGLALDENLCRQLLGKILARAGERGVFIRIDMEDASLTERTLEMFHWARQQSEGVGVVIQAYLYRSEADLMRLREVQGKVRLCKGAYREGADVAFPQKSAVNRKLLSADGRTPPLAAVATHDPARIAFAEAEMARQGLPKGSVEFQMLYGIRRDLQETLVRQGHAVRVYVPYGTHWYPYFMRRLAERPENVRFFLSNLFRK